jgi:hypothetical protein
MRSGVYGSCKIIWAADISRRELIICQNPFSPTAEYGFAENLIDKVRDRTLEHKSSGMIQCSSEIKRNKGSEAMAQFFIPHVIH